MLILSRKKGQAFEIADGVIVTVCSIGKDRVKIGVEAPIDVNVRRLELPKEDDQRFKAIKNRG